MNSILIAESDKELANQIKEIFTDGKTYPICCDTMRKTREMLCCEEWSLVIADERLIDGCGLDLLDGLDSRTIFMAILAKDSAVDIKALLKRGAMDYISKPFSPVVLKAKAITQIVRKKRLGDDAKDSARFGAAQAVQPVFNGMPIYIDKYEFDFDNREYKYSGRGVRLGHLEERLLQLFVENRGVVLKKSTLMECLHAENGQGLDGERLVHAVDSLKKELDAADFIKTVYGVGFMWAANKEK